MSAPIFIYCEPRSLLSRCHLSAWQPVDTHQTLTECILNWVMSHCPTFVAVCTYLRFNLRLWPCWLSFRDQSVVTAAGTSPTWLQEHFDKKNVCISRYLKTYSCFSQTQPVFHVVLHLLIDPPYFCCSWAKRGNTLFDTVVIYCIGWKRTY